MSGTNTPARGTSKVEGLVTLKSPEEQGTKKQYDDFLEKIENHLLQEWAGGQDIGTMLKDNKALVIPEPKDLTAEQEKFKWQQVVWKTQIKKYVERVEIYEASLYSLIMGNLSTITRGKVKAKEGYPLAAEANDPLWLLGVLEDIMTNFGDAKKKTLA